MTVNNILLITLLLTGCVFDAFGIGKFLTSGESSTSSTVTTSTTSDVIPTSSTSVSTIITEIKTTEANTDTVGVNTSSTGMDTSTGGINTTSLTGNETSGTSTNTSNNGSSGNESSFTGSIEDMCGNGILDLGEDCDPLLFVEDKQGITCLSQDSGFHKKCTFFFTKELGIWTNGGALPGMNTPAYDKEEANLICQLWTKNPISIAKDFNINLGYLKTRNFIFTQNIGGNMLEFRSATEFYTKKVLYVVTYAGLGNKANNMDPIFYTFGCT